MTGPWLISSYMLAVPTLTPLGEWLGQYILWADTSSTLRSTGRSASSQKSSHLPVCLPQYNRYFLSTVHKKGLLLLICKPLTYWTSLLGRVTSWWGWQVKMHQVYLCAWNASWALANLHACGTELLSVFLEQKPQFSHINVFPLLPVWFFKHYATQGAQTNGRLSNVTLQYASRSSCLSGRLLCLYWNRCDGSPGVVLSVLGAFHV